MASDLTLYTNPMSRGRIARWMLEEVGQPYDAVVLDYGTTMKESAFLEINPMGKVPTIVHAGHVVTEGAAICAYLADAFPEAGLAPPPTARAAYYRWLFFAAGPVEAAVTNKALNLVYPPERQGMMGYGTYDLMVDTLEQAVTGRDHLAGEKFSAADVYVGSQIIWGLMFDTIPKRDAFVAYAARLEDRPSYKRAAEIDDALMPPPAG